MSAFLADANERTFAHSLAGPARQAILGETEWTTYRSVAGDPELETVVGIHGLGSQGGDLLEVLRLAGVSGVVLDLPGFGQSSRPDRDYPVATAVARVLELLDRLDLERPLWFGCSYGGHVALRAALDHPLRVGGLVLAGSGGLDPNPPAAVIQAFDERLMALRPPAAVGMACDALVGRHGRATLAFRARRLTAHMSGRTDYRAVSRSAQGALEDDATRHLERIEVPVELVHGEHDRLVSPSVVRAAARRLPGATLTTLSGVGHMPWLEAPALVADRLRRMALPSRSAGDSR